MIIIICTTTSTLTTKFQQLNATGVHPFTGLFVDLVHPYEDLNFKMTLNPTANVSAANTNTSFWPYSLSTLNNSQPTAGTIPSTYLAGITSRATLLSMLGIYDFNAAISYINGIMASFTFPTATNGLSIYNFTDKFGSKAYKYTASAASTTTNVVVAGNTTSAASTTTNVVVAGNTTSAASTTTNVVVAGNTTSAASTTTNVVVAGNVASALYGGALTNDPSNPYGLTHMTPTNLTQSSVTQQVVINSYGCLIQKQYTAINNSLQIPMNMPGAGIAVIYSADGTTITYSMFFAEIASLNANTTTGSYYSISELRYIITATNLIIMRIFEKNQTILHSVTLGT